MKIKVLQNFGLDGEDLAAGTIVDVDLAHFGDNVEAFRAGGFFVEVDVPAEPVDVKPSSATPTAPATTTTVPSSVTLPPASEPITAGAKTPEEPLAPGQA